MGEAASTEGIGPADVGMEWVPISGRNKETGLPEAFQRLEYSLQPPPLRSAHRCVKLALERAFRQESLGIIRMIFDMLLKDLAVE